MEGTARKGMAGSRAVACGVAGERAAENGALHGRAPRSASLSEPGSPLLFVAGNTRAMTPSPSARPGTRQGVLAERNDAVG